MSNLSIMFSKLVCFGNFIVLTFSIMQQNMLKNTSLTLFELNPFPPPPLQQTTSENIAAKVEIAQYLYFQSYRFFLFPSVCFESRLLQRCCMWLSIATLKK